MKLVIGTRGSNLAYTQTCLVRDMIQEKYPHWDIEVKTIVTKGDKILDKPISKIGGKEIFIKEIQKALIDGEIDLAVHSMKDVPGVLPDGHMLTFVPKREDYRDVLVLKEEGDLSSLPKGARIGTGSQRREFQLLEERPDLEIVPIRGNVETRIGKIVEEDLDGVVLAAAGIHRLGLEPDHMTYLDIDEMIPSPTQGILAIEIRKSDKELHDGLMALNDETSMVQSIAEREYLETVGGSCTVPVGAYLQVEDDGYTLLGMLGDDEGNVVKSSIQSKEIEGLGKALGEDLQEKLLAKKGIVYLVSGGPGDEDLITVKGLEAIKIADTIVYDRLSSPNLLRHNPDAKKIYVGKKAANHTMTQDEINETLYREAKAGKTVVRLKGGDNYVFGRGGEEAIYLKDRGIAFEPVPGVTSAIGGLAYAGIPITHRDVATSFHVMTGHTRKDEDLNYDSLAKLKGTLVFLMGFGNLDRITNGLITSGKDPKTPVAIINWATTSKQRTVVGDLETIYDIAHREGITAPALIVVGDVVNLREDLKFFEDKPLFGENIVITREAKRAESTIEKFKALGANVLSFPMIKTEFIDSKDLTNSIDNIEDYDYIYFTSVNGVNFFMERFLELSDIRKMANIKFCTIGIKTYNALKNYGIKSELMPELFEGMEAVEVLKAHVKPEDKVLVPRAKLGRNEIVEELKNYCKVSEVQIYDTVATDTGREDIVEGLKDLDDYKIIFTSSSTFTNFEKILGDDLEKILEKGTVVSIGPITTQTVEEAGYSVDIEAREYTIDGIIEEIRR